MTRSDIPAPKQRSRTGEALIVVVLLFVLIFCVGVIVGFFDEAASHGPTSTDVLVGGGLFVIASLGAWQLITRTRNLLASSTQNVGPSVRKTQALWTFFIAVGFVSGMALQLLQRDGGAMGAAEFITWSISDSPIGPSMAVVLLIGMAVVTLASVYYYRLIDEHEFAAQSHASLIAINVYFVSAISWWIANKGGLALSPHQGAIMAVTLLTFVAAWLWRRYR